MKKQIFLALGIASLIVFACKDDDKENTNDPTPTTELSFTDSRDQKKYTYVQIGTQYWMSESLNYAGSGECYNSSSDSCAKYGRLYDGDQAKTACPNGWHLPTDDEWKTLETYLGMSNSDLNLSGLGSLRGDGIGTKLKVGGSSKMDLQLSGRKAPNGASGYIGSTGNYWTATDSSISTYAMARSVQNTDSYVKRYWMTKSSVEYCVRCIKD